MGCRSPHGIHQQPIILLPLWCLFAVVIRGCFTFREAEFLFNCLPPSRILYGRVSNGPNETGSRSVVGPVFAQDVERRLESRERGELDRLSNALDNYSTLTKRLESTV
jgi:hypothetical protein